MIKRIIGVVATLAILVLVVFTALDCGKYETMLPKEWFEKSQPLPEPVPVEEITEDVTSAEVTEQMIETDSLQVEVVE